MDHYKPERNHVEGSLKKLDLLLFRLDGPQLYGINIFKVREILPTPSYSPVPKADERIVGIGDIRGDNLVLIDLPACIGLPPLKNQSDTFTLISEFSNQKQGFLVKDVERIAYISWSEVTEPPQVLSSSPYLTAVTRYEGEIVHVIDVEKVMEEITGVDPTLNQSYSDLVEGAQYNPSDFFVLAADDSRVARGHLEKLFRDLGVRFKVVNNGRQALELLKQWAKDAEDGMAAPVNQRVLLVLSDVEMPEMDGYTLTQEIRKDPRLNNLHVVLNSSLTGQVNEEYALKVGADHYLTKWDVDSLGKWIVQEMARHHTQQG